MIGRWDANGNERISCADPRARRDIFGDRAKTPPSIALCRALAARPIGGVPAERSYAVIVSESACRPLAVTGGHEKRRRV